MYFIQSNYFEIVDNEKQIVELMRNDWYQSKSSLSLDSFRKAYAKHILSLFPNIVLRTKTNQQFIEDCLTFKVMLLSKKKPILEELTNLPPKKVSNNKKSLKSKKK